MKKLSGLLSIFLVLMVTLASCSQTDCLFSEDSALKSRAEQIIVFNKTIVDTTTTITAERATDIALKLTSGVASRSYLAKRAVDVQTITDEAGNPLMYVVNYADNQGYAIISATQEYYPILATGDNGRFDVSAIDSINPVSFWLDMQKEYI